MSAQSKWLTAVSFATVVIAVAASAAPARPSDRSLVKDAEQIRCELFADTEVGQSACRATRAWITITGERLTDQKRINTQVPQIGQPSRLAQSARPPLAGRPRSGGAVGAVQYVPRSDIYVTFDTNSSFISDEVNEQTRNLYQAINDISLSHYRFEVAGHTDAVGSAMANQDLSVKRAQAVADMLIQRGVDRSRFVIKGYGFTKPIEGLSRTDGMNRRVEIKRLP